MHLFLKLFILVKRSTCFGRTFRPSSGDQNCIYGNRHMPLLSCSKLMHHLFIILIIFFYMFRATRCSSSGGFIVYIQHLVLCMSLFLGDHSVHRQIVDWLATPLTAYALSGHLRRVTYKEPDAVCIQWILLMMSIMLLETCRGMW